MSGTAAFGVSSAAGAAVAELAPLVGAFMSLAICKACVEALFSDKSVLRKNKSQVMPQRDAKGGS